jgi:tRNA (guanine-N7-)-methyltransferase
MRKKNFRFDEILHMPNVVECYDFESPELTLNPDEKKIMKGKWRSDFLRNEKEIVLELACGSGGYTRALAKIHPEQNFIGMDIKGDRIWKGASKSIEQELGNVYFLRGRIEFIENYFGPQEVDEIWITFPDPFPRKSKSNRRLTSPFFLEKYRKFLKKGGIIHLKTDDPGLYEFSLESIQNFAGAVIHYHHYDIYSLALPYPELEIKTYYEMMHLANAKTIKYIRFGV